MALTRISRTRRFVLGSGPLKRPTDHLHALSRLVVLASLLAAVPIAVAVALGLSTALQATAHRQAADHRTVTATLLGDSPPAVSPTDDQTLVAAAWAGPGGRVEQGRVRAPGGLPAGATVHIWLDQRGHPMLAPLGSADIAAEALGAGLVTALAVPLLVGCAHLALVRLLDGIRFRRWTAEWAAVEPVWAGRAR